jgi:microcystin degradation protein MlrC
MIRPTLNRPLRIAVGGFMLESNSHAPVATREEFESICYLVGARLSADWRQTAPSSPGTITGYLAQMDAHCGGSAAWEAVPLVCAKVNASGCVDQIFFDEVVRLTVAHLHDALAIGPLDAVFLSLHGAAIGTVDQDPDGSLLQAVRQAIGPQVPLLATLDLHGNINQRMVDQASVLVSYITNPHVDMFERGQECAKLTVEMLEGMEPRTGFQKLPFCPPSVTQNTKFGPYSELIHYGQSKLDDTICNVSILSGFTLGDTIKNGMSVIVTARNDKTRAQQVAREIAQWAWDRREHYQPKLITLDTAVKRALDVGRDNTQLGLCFADVADNPGGGGRGNTMFILEAFHQAGVSGAVFGPIYAPEVAAQATAIGVGGKLLAHFNLHETQTYSKPFQAQASVEVVHSGRCVGRRGIAAGHSIDMGPTVLLRLDGIQVLVVSVREQAKDPVLFEMVGLDLAKVRSLVLKSRGHFRAAIDEFFADAQILEVDVPGLTTPVLKNVAWQRMPRPTYPIDLDTTWSAQ